MLGRSKYFVLTFVLMLAPLCRAGVVYSAEMEKFGKKTTFEVLATDTRAKFSVTAGNDPSMPTGFSIVALDRGERIVILVPGRNGYFDVTREQFKSLMKNKAASSGVEVQAGKLEELVVDQEGGKVAGVQTRYYKIKVSVTSLANGQLSNLVATEEFWTAPSLSNPAPSLDMLTSQTSGIEKLDTLLAYKKLKGYPLKRVVQLSINGEVLGTSVVEVKTIAEREVPDSAFEVPPTYKKLELPGRAGPK